MGGTDGPDQELFQIWLQTSGIPFQRALDEPAACEIFPCVQDFSFYIFKTY